MPTKPLKQCTFPGCPALVKSGRCDKHKRQERRRWDDNRGNSGERGYNAQWYRLRAVKVSLNPLCEICLARGVFVPVAVVHHVEPISKRPDLRLSLDNLLSVCLRCHSDLHKND